MKKLTALLCAFALVISAGCDSPEETPEPAEGQQEEMAQQEEEPEEEPEEEVAAGPMELGDLGIIAEVPPGAEIGEAVVGDGVMVQGPELIVTVQEAAASHDAELADAIERFEDMYSAESVESEEFDNGWLVTFVNTGGAGENFWVQSYRTIGETSYYCETTAHTEAHQENAAALCRSLSASS